MNTIEEKEAVEEIEAKIKAGKPLTKEEETIIAYSPFADVQRCHACGDERILQPRDVTEIIGRPSES